MDIFVQSDDSPINSLYLALVQCFAIILCGYIAGRLNVIRKSEANGLNTFVGTFSLPALIFLSLAKLDFSLVNWKFLLAILISKSAVFFVVLIISLLTTRPSNPGRSALFAIFTTQSNDFAIGYPMISALYGTKHPEYPVYLYLLAPISLAILNPIGFIFLEIGKRHSEEQGTTWQMFVSIAKGVALNPVLVMTVLGIIGNFIFTHNVPALISVILEVFGNAFSASALFLLGLMMVGKVHKLKGTALVVPGILISIKLLVLPLIIRESIILLNAGTNVTDTGDLSTFGFLYGTIPTAPALFIFTLRYNIDIDLIASAMVVCTFLSAPLMFISAKLINAVSAGVTPASYARDLKAFSLDTSAASVAICLWLLICFLGLGKTKFKSVTHRGTLCLIIAQLATAIGVIIWTKLDLNNIGSALWYIQFFLITAGIYASRLWTVGIAVILLLLHSQYLSLANNALKWFLAAGWGVPIMIVTIMCLSVTPKVPGDDELRNPSFQLGRVQVAVSILVLMFSFIVTLGSLIIQQRHNRRDASSLSNLISPARSETTRSERNVVDVEDLVSPVTNLINVSVNGNCSAGFCDRNEACLQDCDNESDIVEAEFDQHQVLQHVILLILLLCSIFVGLSLSVATLIMEEMTGIYAELAFLDVALSFGQSLIVFAIFGLNPGFGKMGCWINKLCQKWRAESLLELPDEETLSPETRAIREQFRSCHLANCRARIAVCRRRLLKVYKAVFTGSDLVNWLLEAGVASNREEAVRYGKCLLDSRVLCHVDGTQHFQDTNLLYSFST